MIRIHRFLGVKVIWIKTENQIKPNQTRKLVLFFSKMIFIWIEKFQPNFSIWIRFCIWKIEKPNYTEIYLLIPAIFHQAQTISNSPLKACNPKEPKPILQSQHASLLPPPSSFLCNHFLPLSSFVLVHPASSIFICKSSSTSSPSSGTDLSLLDFSFLLLLLFLYF